MRRANGEQRGQVYIEHGRYFVRYYDWRVVEGKRQRKRLRKEIGPVAGMTQAQAEARARELLDPVNHTKLKPETAVGLVEFVEQEYLPRVAKWVRPDTLRGYTTLWRKLRPYVEKLWMREVGVPQMQDVLEAIAATGRYNTLSLRHHKAFFSGLFAVALQRGFYDGTNPMHDTRIPKGVGVRPANKTKAYSWEEVEAMLAVLGEPARTIVALAALTGLSRSEIQGLQWANFNGTELRVERSVVDGVTGPPKTAERGAPVPVIPYLTRLLEAHRQRSLYARDVDPIFATSIGTPVWLQNLATLHIRPILRKAGIAWHGWHGFRRSLVTNLIRLNVPLEMVQKVVRHADASTTRKHYAKLVAADARAAMDRLGEEVMDRKWTEIPAHPSVN